MRTRHPAEGTLRAYLDGELPPLPALRCAWHVRRCAACRAGLEEAGRLERRTAELVRRLGTAVDVEEGWQRLIAVTGGAHQSRLRSAWAALAIGSATLLTALAVALAHRPAVHGDANRANAQMQDVCCWDLDGGGPGDDGIFTLSRAGEVVECVVLYDDVDGSTTLTPADHIRYVSSPRACGTSSAPRSSQSEATLRLASLASLSGAPPPTPVNSSP